EQYDEFRTRRRIDHQCHKETRASSPPPDREEPCVCTFAGLYLADYPKCRSRLRERSAVEVQGDIRGITPAPLAILGSADGYPPCPCPSERGLQRLCAA